jgi:hypothetical protein
MIPKCVDILAYNLSEIETDAATAIQAMKKIAVDLI